MSKEIFVVKKEAISNIGLFNFISSLQDNESISFRSQVIEGVRNLIKLEEQGFYMDREIAEQDPDYKQIIPQILVIDESLENILLHEIPQTGNESRLFGKSSIFLGGHMDPEDMGEIMAAASREFSEEIECPKPNIKYSTVAGFLDLNNSPVNAVHFGVIFVYCVKDVSLVSSKKDPGVENVRFVSWEEAYQNIHNMTDWSKVALPMLEINYRKK